MQALAPSLHPPLPSSLALPARLSPPGSTPSSPCGGPLAQNPEPCPPPLRSPRPDPLRFPAPLGSLSSLATLSPMPPRRPSAWLPSPWSSPRRPRHAGRETTPSIAPSDHPDWIPFGARERKKPRACAPIGRTSRVRPARPAHGRTSQPAARPARRSRPGGAGPRSTRRDLQWPQPSVCDPAPRLRLSSQSPGRRDPPLLARGRTGGSAARRSVGGRARARAAICRPRPRATPGQQRARAPRALSRPSLPERSGDSQACLGRRPAARSAWVCIRAKRPPHPPPRGRDANCLFLVGDGDLWGLDHVLHLPHQFMYDGKHPDVAGASVWVPRRPLCRGSQGRTLAGLEQARRCRTPAQRAPAARDARPASVRPPDGIVVGPCMRSVVLGRVRARTDARGE